MDWHVREDSVNPTNYVTDVNPSCRNRWKTIPLPPRSLACATFLSSKYTAMIIKQEAVTEYGQWRIQCTHTSSHWVFARTCTPPINKHSAVSPGIFVKYTPLWEISEVRKGTQNTVDKQSATARVGSSRDTRWKKKNWKCVRVHSKDFNNISLAYNIHNFWFNRIEAFWSTYDNETKLDLLLHKKDLVHIVWSNIKLHFCVCFLRG